MITSQVRANVMKVYDWLYVHEANDGRSKGVRSSKHLVLLFLNPSLHMPLQDDHIICS